VAGLRRRPQLAGGRQLPELLGGHAGAARGRLGEEVGELGVVDDGDGLLPVQHLRDLAAGRAGVEVQQVAAGLGDGDRGLDEPAPVAGEQPDG
jgi:hypothetical protein